MVVLLVAWLLSTANRLDRLHIRYDKAWQSLDASLARRAVVARAIAQALEEPRIARLADRAERADRGDREDAENQLSAALSQVAMEELASPLAAELADAEARVMIARRFHNDAVGDTRALRHRRPVRWLGLAGTAPQPRFFEIIEREFVQPVEHLRATVARGVIPEHAPARAATDSAREPMGEPAAAPRRESGRVLLLDGEGSVLLVRGTDPEDPGQAFWFTPGGGVEDDEDVREAARREVAEETGRIITDDELIGPVWDRTEEFTFNGSAMRSEERIFVCLTGRFEPVPTGLTELESRMVLGFRWCDAAAIRELCAQGEQVYPRELAGLLVEAEGVASGRVPVPPLRSIT
ncbi:NUDIX hydrolase [Lolliginicoccus suaedae]|uniref:NUDIX hydrolase n=1 Tax=Lolliginicoccus suaedae TaxID=2605429 RepID=UPI0011ECD748|nr:NUDIX domain-containing protein [Lolliginicoccus suaedae]